MDINLPNGVNIILASSQFIINNITKPPKIPFTPLLIPHVLSSSLKKEIVERIRKEYPKGTRVMLVKMDID